MTDIVLSRPLFDIPMPRCTNAAHPPLSTLEMPLWHQVAHATAIPSGIISLYRGLQMTFQSSDVNILTDT